mmetsp:Transcript_50784/g.122457  ORF Transcript_50784/g.122457 Transcript_50784/m.122457 type:complete len:199 (+) Transcript_50784:240-836(+)|eukprot:CAMPEP_0113457030 /NCGR_PEP_ID=MMETSP0014_2-20120614/9194_1 /TAXON_ID=2857 /ORGANISM="Nitzschia sp." /LENGTH=198 /DNA_ID=CAMNT_0000348505 /DNA_START=240 /DNA_END=836 /DNA_ORIENTATION=+ /assembly_acc=CAM_ASM_000159
MPKKVIHNEGKFTEEEIELFNEGLRIHGKDFKLVALHIGTRSLAQVRAKCNYNMNKEGVLFSPTKGKKKRTASDDAKTPSKKAKATPAKATRSVATKAPASAAKAAARPTRSAKKAVAPKTPVSSRKKKAAASPPPSELEEEEETLEKAVETAPTDGAVTTMIPPKMTEIVKKEEVQAVLAGFAGFLVAFLVKKFLLS